MVNIKTQLVTGGNRRTNSGTNTRQYITIHETANTSKGADAQAHANLQSRGFTASWHYTVDDKQAIQSYEHTARCWHAGNTRGNNQSIGVEICVNSDGDFAKALKNAAELVAHIMRSEGIPIQNVVQHNYWSGKNCPTNLRRDGWASFLDAVAGGGPATVAPAPTPPAGKSIGQLADEVIAGKHGTGDARKRSLGDRYAEVQAEVNRRLSAGGSAPAPAAKSVATLAQEVLDGKHGNGDDRRRSLGAQYDAVQAEVNRRLSGGAAASASAGRSVSQMASEVLAGKHGNGHANRQRSLGVDAATYAKVRAEVNRRA